MIIKAVSLLRHLRNAPLVFSIVVGVALTTSAQVVGRSRGLSGGDGNHSIQGWVYFPAGQPGQ
jgi:hypothetical protein